MLKRLLAMFLCIVMCVSMVPVQAFAEDGVDESITEETHSHESEAVRVEFNCNPAETIIWVASDTVDDYAPEEDGSFLLQPGHYYYMAYCGGYVGIEEELVIEEGSENMTVDVVLRVEGTPEEELANNGASVEPTPAPTAEPSPEPTVEPAVEPTTDPNTDTAETPETTASPEPVAVRAAFNCTPAETLVRIADEFDYEYQAEEDGSFLLLPGNYFYEASCEGYVDIEEELIIEEGSADMTIDVVLEPSGVKFGSGYEEVILGEEYPNEDAYIAYLETLFYDNAISTFGILAGEKLPSAVKGLYNYVKAQIENVASGQLTSSEFYPYISFTVSCNSESEGKDIAKEAVYKMFDAIRHDCPYELYWSNGNGSWSYTYSYDAYRDELYYTVHMVRFAVAGNHRVSADDEYTFNTSDALTAVAASRNAKNIVSQFSGYSDYQKLLAYKNKICDLVEYDYDAADSLGANPDYADMNNAPWQLINVFDNKTNTNVVCAGYAEAFQYLCDISTFSNDVDCYSVTGYAGGGFHEWNIVNVNGTSYHVDVTWCDGGHAMFMVGGSGSIASGYTIKGSKYVYYDDVKQLWGTGSNSILKLSSSDLDPNSLDNKPSHSHSYSAKVTAPTCTAQGYTTYTCSCGDTYKGNYVSAKGHSYGAWTTTKAATCTATGTQRRDCNNCDYYETKSIAATGHKYTSKVTAPTCTAQGYTTYTCSCGYSYKSNYVSAKGHDFGAWYVIAGSGKECRDCNSCDFYEIRDLLLVEGTFNGSPAQVDANGNLLINEANFPDANFRNYISESYDSAGKGYLTEAAAKNVDYMFCGNEGIASLKGIEYFTALTDLWCSNNQLSYLDVSKNTALIELLCTNNQLSYLDVSKNTALTDLWCSNNQLSSLNVSKNTALISLACDDNQLSSLDVSKNTALTDLWCENNRLSSLNVSNNTALTSLGCYSNQLTNLFLRNNTKLEYLACNMQKATADAYMENGKYFVDMKEVVRAANIPNVTVTSGGTYDKLTGIVTLNAPASGAKTAVLVYNYAHGSTLNSTMDVTLTVSLTNNAKLPVPTVTLGNNSSSGKPVVSWEEVPGAVGYEVYGKNSKASAYELYNYTESCSFTHNAAEIGETYYYRVRALHSSAASNSAFSTAKAATCDLKMPSISVSNNASSGKPVVSWGAISGAASYDVYARSGNTSTYTKLTNTSSTSYNHSNAVAGETYIYKVRAVHSNAAANSAFSGGKGIVCDLKIPTLAVSTNATSGKPVVSWSAVAGVASYDIYARDSQTSVYTKLTNTSSTSYNHSNAEAGETYIYKVRAVHSNPSANSAFSGGMGVVCDLKMPTISISNNATTGKPTVSWNQIPGASSYDIYARSSKTSVYTKLGNTSAASFNHSDAVAGETYFYKVRAVHSKASANSAFTGGKGYICDLAMPTINVGRAESGKPMVSWNVIPGAAGYEVYVRTSDTSVYTKLATAYGSSFIHSDAEKGEVYFYKVRAIHSNASANSVLSEGKGITSR